MSQPARCLFIRMDRIGDLIMTLPVDESMPLAQVNWWIPKGLSFITNHASPRREAIEQAKEISFFAFFSLLKKVRAMKLDAAVVFQGPWWVGALLLLAGVPLRVGVKSKWHSFLFFNRAVRQKRSRSEHSELEYNYRLLEEGLRLPVGQLPRTHLKLQSSSSEVLSKFSLEKEKYSVVHPGMSGSARNWPTDHYEEFIRLKIAYEPIVITGTASDEPYLAPLRERFAGEPRVMWLDKKLSGSELISILANARTITAPSTGVMHIAASTGQPTLGIFSPVRVQRPTRWGPQGARTETLLPEVDCPGELNCLGRACPHWDCMYLIKPADAIR